MLTQILPATNLLLIITISIIAIHNFSFLNRHRNDKNRLRNEISFQYPLVKQEFYNQPISQQIVENNQEIHEINKRLEKYDARIGEIKETLKSLTKVIEELHKNG